MFKTLRYLAAFLVCTALAHAQTANIQGIFLSGSPPTGFSGQAFKMDCNNASPSSGQCWPLMEIWDKAGNQMSVNPNGQASANNSSPVVLPLTQITADPCTLHGDVIGTATKTSVAFSSSAGEFQVVAPFALNQVYICAITLVSTAADSISIVGGLAPNCTTGFPLAIVGSVTAANGMDIAANQGWQAGNGGATVYSTATSGHGVCILQSGATKIAGAITYVQTQF